MTEELINLKDYFVHHYDDWGRLYCVEFKGNPLELENSIKRLEQENKDLKKQIESDKGLITVGGKQQYQYSQKIDELEQKNKELKETAKDLIQSIQNCNIQRTKMYKALEEIREKLKYWETYFCDNCPFQNKDACDKNEKNIGGNTCTSVQLIKIQDKINEVLNEGK